MAICFHEFVAVDVLSRGLSSAHKPQMVCRKASWVWGCQEAIDEHGKWDSVLADRLIEGNILSRSVPQTLTQTAEYKKSAEQCTGTHEREEEAIVSSAYTVIDPNAMMVYCFDATVAYTTVMTSWWSPDIACFTIFGRHVHSCIGISGGLHHCPRSGLRTQSERVVGPFGCRERM